MFTFKCTGNFKIEFHHQQTVAHLIYITCLIFKEDNIVISLAVLILYSLPQPIRHSPTAFVHKLIPYPFLWAHSKPALLAIVLNLSRLFRPNACGVFCQKTCFTSRPHQCGSPSIFYHEILFVFFLSPNFSFNGFLNLLIYCPSLPLNTSLVKAEV